MALQTADYETAQQIAIDHGWLRTGVFRNMNGDRCIRGRWVKGAGRSERVMYLAVNVDSGEIADLRAIKANREQLVSEATLAVAIEILKSK